MLRAPILIISMVLLLFPPHSRGLPQEIPPPNAQDATERISEELSGEAEEIYDFLYRGRPDLALGLVEHLVEASPDLPLPYLIKARVLREKLSEQDDEKDLIKEDAAPIHDVLDRAIEICERQMETSDDDSRLRLYRGWAWMFKAQLHALGGSYWSAGRSAAKGNKDLKKYISKHPDDPDAKGILGTFLYFADALPSVIKIIKTLFFIPGGDREKGLEYLEYACSHRGLLTTDHQIILASIHAIFEGRIEQGVEEFIMLLEQYPDYLRLVEPLGVARTFYPGKVRLLQQIENAVIARHMANPKEGLDRDTIYRLRYHRSYTQMFFEAPLTAIDEFSALIEEAPDRPDWLVPLSLVNLGCLYANSGAREKARETYSRILEDERMKRFHEVASKMMEKPDKAEDPFLEADAGFIRQIYISEQAWAEAGLEDYRRRNGTTLLYDFYQGEHLLISGDLEGASRHFLSALDRKMPVYAQSYQMIAAIRLAEIRGAQGKYDEAKDFLERALKYYHKEFLVDMLVKGRKKFYEGLAKGELDMAPSLLPAAPRTPTTSDATSDATSD